MKKIKRLIQVIALSIVPVALLGVNFFKASGPMTKTIALAGEGTSEDPIIISTSAELEEVMSNVDSGTDYANKYLSITNDLSVSLTKTTNGKTFRGHLDGGNHTITLSTSATGDEVAMFNCVGSVASVSNIVFAGNISGVGAKSSTVCSWNYGTIKNIINNCQLTSTNTNGYLGGIAASQIANTASIQNCVNNAVVSGNKYVGGIVGNLRVGTISNTTNKGNVTASSTSVAGIAGLIGQANNKEFDAVITNCINEGNISGTGQVAGIAGGIFPKLTCTSCSNYGDITTSGNSGAGGIAGFINSNMSSTFSFTDCYSSGTVTTNAGWAGGLFGYAGSGSLGTISFTNVLSASKVVDNSATGNIGGFMAGQNSTAATFNLVKCQSMASISYSGSNAFSTGIALSKTNIVADEDTNLAVNDKEHGVELSDTTIKLIRAIREFNCSYDSTMASIVSTGVDNLTPDEIDVLFLTVHYGANDYADTYYGSALYINEFLSNNVSGLNRIFPGITLNNKAVLIAVIISVSAILGSLSLLLLRKRKSI